MNPLHLASIMASGQAAHLLISTSIIWYRAWSYYTPLVMIGEPVWLLKRLFAYALGMAFFAAALWFIYESKRWGRK